MARAHSRPAPRRMHRVRVKTPRIACPRPALSVLLAIVYALGTIALPSLHLGLHRNDHDHRGGSIHWHSLERHLSAQHDHLHEHSHPDPPKASLGDGQEIASAPSQHADWHHRSAPKSELVAALAFDPDSRSAPSPGDPAHAGGSLAHFAEVFFASATHSFLPLVGPLAAPAAPPEYINPALVAWSADPRKARAPPRASVLL